MYFTQIADFTKYDMAVFFSEGLCINMYFATKGINNAKGI